MSAGDLKVAAPRLTLRPYRFEDFDAMQGLMADPRAHLFPARAPLGEEEAWARLLRHIGHWQALGIGFFAVAEKGSGAFVGESGFHWFRRGLGPRFDAAPEASWTIAPARQGQGLATEAAAAAHQWLEQAHGRTRTVCMIHPDNKPSLRVAAKLGYRAFETTRYKDQPAILLERGTDDERNPPRERQRMRWRRGRDSNPRYP